MKKVFILFLLLFSNVVYSQSLEEKFGKMESELETILLFDIECELEILEISTLVYSIDAVIQFINQINQDLDSKHINIIERFKYRDVFVKGKNSNLNSLIDSWGLNYNSLSNIKLDRILKREQQQLYWKQIGDTQDYIFYTTFKLSLQYEKIVEDRVVISQKEVYIGVIVEIIDDKNANLLLINP